MSWSGGVYTRTNGVYSGAHVWQSDFNALVKIVYSRHDVHDQDLAQGINACLNKNGQNSPTTNINWGGFKITNLAYGSADKDSATYGQTVTGVAVDPTSKVLTLSRTQGNLTVDLTPITVAGDTSDFARKSLSNTWSDTNYFNDNLYANASIRNYDAGDTNITQFQYARASLAGIPTWRLSWMGNYSNGFMQIAPNTSSPDGAYLYINSSKVLTENNFDVTGFLKTTGAYSVAGDWTISGAWSFSQSLQVKGLVIAGVGYSWAVSVPSSNAIQLVGTGGNFLKLTPDGTYGSKLQSLGPGGGGTTYWNDANLVVGAALPLTGADFQVALVTAGADKGVWVYVAPSGWTKIAS